MAWAPNICSPSRSLAYWSTQSKEVTTVVNDAGAAVVGCNRAMLVFTRTTPTGTREDVMTCNMHIAKVAGPLRGFFTAAAELDALKAIYQTWWTSLKVYVNNQVTFKEIRWYVVRDDQAKLGPPIRVDAIGVAGTAINKRGPDQVAATQTLITASAKHWGRFYLPGLTVDFWDAVYGRGSSANIDPASGYTRTMLNSVSAAGYELGVWSPRALSFLDTWRLQMDDIPDIQRRRRAKQPNYKKIYTS